MFRGNTPERVKLDLYTELKQLSICDVIFPITLVLSKQDNPAARSQWTSTIHLKLLVDSNR